MTKRNALLMALVVSLIMLAQPIGGIGCLVKASEADSLITTAQNVVYTQMQLLEEQKFEEPNPPAPLEVNLDNVEFTTIKIDAHRSAHIGGEGSSGSSSGSGSGDGDGDTGGGAGGDGSDGVGGGDPDSGGDGGGG